MKTGILMVIVLSGLACAVCGQIRISEIHYHPVELPAFNADGTPVLDLNEDVHEFVEIQNIGAAAVDLSGWTLKGGIHYSFPTNTAIAPGTFRVIAKTPARLAIQYSLAATNVLGPYTGALGNNSDTIRLQDAAGVVADSVSYDSRFPWAQSADALGAQDRFTGLSSTNYQYRGRSLQRVSVNWPSSDPANWLASPLTGPTPGAPQAVTRAVPKPVVVAQSAVQTADGAAIVRATNAVTVNCAFSATNGLSGVSVEYFVDDVNSTSETRNLVAMADLGGGNYMASIPGQPDRSIVRYRFKANRGEGLETASPRQDDPQIAPVGPGGAREAWHAYFVTPTRASANPIYDVFVSTASLFQMNVNITQKPKRVTAASAAGLPRAVPYVAATAPQWDGTQPAVFACNGQVWDIQIRYHGSLFHRAAANNSFKVHFPEHHPFNGQSAWFETGHGAEFVEAQKVNRLLGLPASKMRTVDWHYNANATITRSEQGEYAGEMLDEYHELQQQLNPGAEKESSGELYKVVGNRSASQNNLEGPYTRGDEAPLAANAGWTQLQRYDWTMALQDHPWKGPKPVRDLIEGMWTARGDTPSTHSFAGDPTKLANARAWFTNNWDIDTTLTSMALLEWMSIWDDACQNHFWWRRANGKWSRLGWDYDQVMSAGGGGGGGGLIGGTTNQTIYGGEYGAPNVFDGVNWWKDTFFKCFRAEYNQRLWELNNSFFDPANLTAQGLPVAAAFAPARRGYINTQLSSLGVYSKPARPANLIPSPGAAILGPTNLLTSPYSHPQSAVHASTKWELRSATGNYEAPVLRLTSTSCLTNLPVPFEHLTYGQTYYWRATHIDLNGHPSVVSAETSFTWGTSNTAAGTLVLNEVLAINANALQNGASYPDYIELRNNGSAASVLTGYTLTDDPLVPAKFSFPAGTTIPAGAYLVVWCDNDTTAPGLHSGFGLDGDGDQVLLLNGTTIVDSLTFGPQAPDVSLGRIVNGTGGWQANFPTPGAANTARPLGSPAKLRVNEWMPNPAYGEDWFEVYNTDSNVVALAGLYLSDTPAIPNLTQVPALSFIAGRSYTRFWADGSSAGGNHCNFKLNKDGESLILTAPNGVTTLDTVTFGAVDKDLSQGRLPDGENTIVAFSSQTASLGGPNWTPAPVEINEVLPNATSPFEGAIELYNPTTSAVTIGGWWLSDDLFNRQKFQIPANTTVPAGGYIVFYESSLASGASPFSLNPLGGEIVLSAVNSGGELTGYGSQAHFGASAPNASFGRVPATGLKASSGGAEFWTQTSHTFGQDNPASVADFRGGTGAPNGPPKIGPLAINEIMYHPVDGPGGADDTQDEFVELYNLTPNTVDLSGWRFKGDSDYLFPSGSSIAGSAYLLLVSFNPTNTVTLAAFRQAYGLTEATPVFGPYSQRLQNNTHDLELACPATIGGRAAYILVDKVEYRDIAPWPTLPDGTGLSLQRTTCTLIGNTAANWSGDVPTPGAINAGVAVNLAIASVSPLPGAIVGVAYTNTLLAVGGATPYTWALADGSVPGLALTADGAFIGAPTQAGAYVFTAQVTDNTNATATKSFEITVASQALLIASGPNLPDGTFGLAYAQTLQATGGSPPYAWSVTGGSMPPGLALSASGALGGTPAAAGAYRFTVVVADLGGLQATRTFALYVPVPPLTITTASPMPEAELDISYSQALTAVGGIMPYVWSVAGGTLPSGLTLDSTGTLSGLPRAHGVFVFTAQVTDGAGATATSQLSLAVVPQALVITTASLPDAIVGDPYSQTLAATGGLPPYTWSLGGGSMPTGLLLASTGTITGAASEAGTCAFIVRVADSLRTNATRPLALAVNASGPLDHFDWDYVPPEALVGEDFAVRLTARDSAQRQVASFSGAVGVSAASGSASFASPILITEFTDEREDQFELQNVSSNAVDATGWFVLLGDSQTDINTLNPITSAISGILAPGALYRISESSSNTANGRHYFGGPIDWDSSAGINSKGWIMLFDDQERLRDFVTLGWTGADLLNLSVDIGGEAVTATGHWSGPPLLPGARAVGEVTRDSWQRVGTNDSNSAADWVWKHNADSSNATSFNLTNTGMILPWAAATPVPLSVSNVPLVQGQAICSLNIDQAVSDVRLLADDRQHSGVSAAFDVLPFIDADRDGLPDGWETAHGLAVGVADANFDPDGDGLTNLAEYRAGTDPRSPSSTLAVIRTSVDVSGQVTISWPGIAGRLYRVSYSTDLTTWSMLDTPFLPTANGPQTATIPSGGASALFVRVRVGL